MKNLTDHEFELFRTLIRRRYGINLKDEKRSLIYSRLRTAVEREGLSSFKEYYDLIVKDKTGDYTREFVDKITTNHTFFMREKEHFDYLAAHVLPLIEERHKKNKDIRLWCAGCSSGEEAYTLQILLQEYFESKPGWDTQILATDISNTVLNKAYRGIYPTTGVEDLPINWRTKYFKPYDEDHMVAADVLKKNISFAKFNFIEDPFKFRKDFQVIFCRNVMIYFNQETRRDLVNKFYSVTEDKGYLFIGQSESLGYSDTKYKYAMPAVYQKVEHSL